MVVVVGAAVVVVVAAAVVVASAGAVVVVAGSAAPPSAVEAPGATAWRRRSWAGTARSSTPLRLTTRWKAGWAAMVARRARWVLVRGGRALAAALLLVARSLLRTLRLTFPGGSAQKSRSFSLSPHYWSSFRQVPSFRFLGEIDVGPRPRVVRHLRHGAGPGARARHRWLRARQLSRTPRTAQYRQLDIAAMRPSYWTNGVADQDGRALTRSNHCAARRRRGGGEGRGERARDQPAHSLSRSRGRGRERTSLSSLPPSSLRQFESAARRSTYHSATAAAICERASRVSSLRRSCRARWTHAVETEHLVGGARQSASRENRDAAGDLGQLTGDPVLPEELFGLRARGHVSIASSERRARRGRTRSSRSYRSESAASLTALASDSVVSASNRSMLPCRGSALPPASSSR